MLIDNNVLYIKSFLINFTNTTPHIQSCSINIVINTKYYTQFLKCRVLDNPTTFIFLISKILVPFKQILLRNSCNFLFHLLHPLHLTLYVHLINYTTFKFLIQNNIDYSIKISQYYRLGYIIELFYKNYFVVLVGYKAVFFLLMSLLLFFIQSKITILLVGISLKSELPKNIKIYANKEVVKQGTYLFNKYPFISESFGFV